MQNVTSMGKRKDREFEFFMGSYCESCEVWGHADNWCLDNFAEDIAHELDLDSTISMIWFAHMNKTFSILKSKWNWCFLFMALINLENYGSIVIMIQDIWRVHAIEYKYSDTKYHYVLVLYLCLQYYPKYGNYFDKPLISISD